MILSQSNFKKCWISDTCHLSQEEPYLMSRTRSVLVKLNRNTSGWGSVLISAPGCFSGGLWHLQFVLLRAEPATSSAQEHGTRPLARRGVYHSWSPTSVRCLTIIPSPRPPTAPQQGPSRPCFNVITFWKFPVSEGGNSPWACKHQSVTPVVKLLKFLPTVG